MHIEILKAMFKSMDKDNDGFITQSDLQKGIREFDLTLGGNMSVKTCLPSSTKSATKRFPGPSFCEIGRKTCEKITVEA